MLPYLMLLAGCIPTTPTVAPLEEPEPIRNVVISQSSDGDTVLFEIPVGANIEEAMLIKTLADAARELDYASLLRRTESDSIVLQTSEHFSHEERLPFRPLSLTNEKTLLSLLFVLDRKRIAAFAENLANPSVIVSPTLVSVVNPEEKGYDSFDYLTNALLLEPCPGISYPKSSNLIPNAPRAYRSGTHRGIDFPAPYGSTIRAAKRGVVIRADHGYVEITNEFRKSLLTKAAHIGRTPSDIFEHFLFGQAVFVDHGTKLVKGKRLVTIYAHMSEIAEGVIVGATVKRGQLLGKVGNSGTSDGALGNKKGAHLHFELIIQDKAGERYMGQGLEYDSLTKLLDRLFVSR